MIGDYVFWNLVTHKVDFDGDVMTDRGYKVSRRIIKVSSVNEVGITFKSLKDRSQISIKEEDLVPIPLTPEILKKNGFESRGAQFFCDHIGMIWWKDNIFMFSKYTRHEDLPTENISINIGYVHELQHALRICGIEKKIEL